MIWVLDISCYRLSEAVLSESQVTFLQNVRLAIISQDKPDRTYLKLTNHQ